MQTLSYDYTIERVPYHGDNVVDLAKYHQNMGKLPKKEQAGLSPLPRRTHRPPLGMRLTDLVSIGVVAMTLAATGMLVAVM